MVIIKLLGRYAALLIVDESYATNQFISGVLNVNFGFLKRIAAGDVGNLGVRINGKFSSHEIRAAPSVPRNFEPRQCCYVFFVDKSGFEVLFV